MRPSRFAPHSAAGRFDDARVGGFSDWFVTAVFSDGARRMRVSYGHGCPYVAWNPTAAAVKVQFSDGSILPVRPGEIAVKPPAARGDRQK